MIFNFAKNETAGFLPFHGGKGIRIHVHGVRILKIINQLSVTPVITGRIIAKMASRLQFVGFFPCGHKENAGPQYEEQNWDTELINFVKNTVFRCYLRKYAE